MLLSAHRTERLVCVHRSAECQSEHPADLLVKALLAELSGKDSLLVGLCKIICIIYAFTCRHLLADPCSELHVKSSEHSLLGVMAACPVGHHHTVKPPLPFQDVVDQIAVMAAVRASEKVVARHHAPCATFLYSHFEGRKIDLPQSTLAHLDVSLVAMPLLVVAGIVLHACAHTL